MANIYNDFLALLPSETLTVGKVLAVGGESVRVSLVGGGELLCTSQKDYEAGQSVFIKGTVITGEAPTNDIAKIYL